MNFKFDKKSHFNVRYGKQSDCGLHIATMSSLKSIMKTGRYLRVFFLGLNRPRCEFHCLGKIVYCKVSDVFIWVTWPVKVMPSFLKFNYVGIEFSSLRIECLNPVYSIGINFPGSRSAAPPPHPEIGE